MPRTKHAKNRRVDAYIESLPAWQQGVCSQVRDLVHSADAGVTETIKRTKLPYFTLEGNVCALLGTKDHVNIFIYDPIAPDPEGIINQGQGNSAARAIQVYEGERIKTCSAEPFPGRDRQQSGRRLAPFAASVRLQLAITPK
jgi:hypothetical protein